MRWYQKRPKSWPEGAVAWVTYKEVSEPYGWPVGCYFDLETGRKTFRYRRRRAFRELGRIERNA